MNTLADVLAQLTVVAPRHEETAGLCQRAGDRYLVVWLEHEDKFRSLVRILGFGMSA